MKELTNEEKEKLIPIERMVMLQGYVDYYLVTHNGKPFYEMYPDIEDKYGILNAKQEEILHLFLEEQYDQMGIKLSDAIAAANDKEVENGLCEFEKKQLLKIADREIIFVGSILKRKEKLYKKN